MKKGRENKHRICAAFLCVCMLQLPGISDLFPVVAAEEQGESFQRENIITAFYPLSEDVKEQTVFTGTDRDELNLPEELTVCLLRESSEQKTEESGQENSGETDNIEEDSEENSEEDSEENFEEDSEENSDLETRDGQDTQLDTHTVTVPEYYAENVISVQTLQNTQAEKQEETVTIDGVTWQSDPEYDGNEEGTYTFTAVLPDGYILAEGVNLPEITVTVESGADAMIQALPDRIAALPDAEEYLAAKPDPDDEEAYAEWEEKLYEYAEEALAIWEEYEAMAEEQQAQVPEEELAKLTAWVKLTETLSDHALMLADNSEHHGESDWQALTSSDTTLSGGKFYLSDENGDLTMGTITIDGDVTLCLNGHKLQHDSTDGSVIVVNSGTFTLCDCQDHWGYTSSFDEDTKTYTCGITGTGGRITGGSGNNFQGGGVYVSSGAAFVMNSGRVTGCDVGTVNKHYGGGVYVTGGTFDMSGGLIDGNNAYCGGGIYLQNRAEFTMSGNAVIMNNESEVGGGVYCEENSVFNMTCGSIIRNKDVESGGGVFVGEGSFIMSGGTIEGNSSYSLNGGSGVGCYKSTTATVMLSGGSIQYNTSNGEAAGGVRVSGTIQISKNIRISDNYDVNGANNVSLNLNSTITVAGELSNDIGVTYRQPRGTVVYPKLVVTGTDSYSISDADWSHFSSDNESYEILKKETEQGNELYLAVPGSCDLLTLSTDGAALSPSFDPGITEYTSTVANSVDEVGITAVLSGAASDAAITIKINDGAEAEMISGTERPVKLKVGENTIGITVTSAGMLKTYTIEITRAAPAEYTVTLHKNGGTGGTDLTSYTFGTGAVLPTNWKKTGYVFDGWYDNESFTGTAVTNILGTDTGNKEYWAKWTDNIAPVIGTLTYNYQPKKFWHWLIGKDSLIITVPVTEEGSGADEITYTVTPEGGTAGTRIETIENGEAKITVSADFKGTISIVCTDKAGNTSAGVTVGAGLGAAGIIIEDHAPQIAFQAENAELLPAGEYRTAPDIAVTIRDDKDNAVSGGIASVSCKIGNGSEKTVAHDYTTSMVVNDSFTIPASGIPAGETVISVTATDHAGNSNTQNYTVKVHIHSGTLIPAAEPTCTTAGNKEYYTCTCGKWFSDSGCTAEITDQSVIERAALGHDFAMKHDQNEHWQQCFRCSLEQSRGLHVYDDDFDPDCNVCGYVRPIQGHTHSAALVPAKAATCTEDGHEAYYTCSCGKWFSDSGCVNEITDHASVIVGKLGHDFSGEYLFNQNGHWKVCSRCGMAQESESHVFDDDNDTACNKCGYQRTIGAHTHSVERTVPAKEPTCTAAGNEVYYICSCGKWFSDGACTIEVTVQDVTIPAKGHTAVTDPAKAAACTETGLTEGSHCLVCGHVIKAQTVTAALGHDYGGDYHYDAGRHWKVCRRCEAVGTKHSHTYDNDRDAYCNDCNYKRAIGSSDDKQPAPTPPSAPHSTDPPQPAPQPPIPTNPPVLPQPAENPDNKPETVPGTPDNSQPEDKQGLESVGTPEPAEKPSETEKEQQPEGDGEHTAPASVDIGEIVISGEPVAAGNVEGMPDTSTVLKLGNGAVIVTVVCTEQEYTAGVADAIAVANAVLMPEQMELVNNGETIEVRIDVKDISDQMPEQDEKAIENGIEAYREEMPELVLGMYVDISMFIRIGAGEWNAVTATDEPIEVVIGIPEKLQSVGREFYIIRAHKGEYALLSDMDESPDTITVSTDLFSSYGIAYVAADEAGAGEGQKCGLCHFCPTFLGICCFVWLAIFILIMIVVMILLRKKKEKQEAQE